MIRFVPPLLILLLWVYCLIEVITAREGGVRNLAKGLWVFIVLLFPLVGSIAWLVLGRPVAERPLTRQHGAAPAHPEYERRGRFAAADPVKDEEFLRSVRERAEEQRRRYEREKRAQDERDSQPDAQRDDGSEEPEGEPTVS